jgi:hypothetical protein
LSLLAASAAGANAGVAPEFGDGQPAAQQRATTADGTSADTSSTTELDISGHQVAADFKFDGRLIAVDHEGTKFAATVEPKSDVAVIDRENAAACSWYTMAIPVGGAWYTSVPGCSLVGFDAQSRHLYQWVVDPHSNGTACLQGRGYKKVSVSWQEQYSGIGCGTGGNVVIGNVSLTPRSWAGRSARPAPGCSGSSRPLAPMSS